jgi:hypothetical protein
MKQVFEYIATRAVTRPKMSQIELNCNSQAAIGLEAICFILDLEGFLLRF